MSPVEFTVLGRPQPAGSKRAFPRKGGGVIVTDDNPRAKSWQQEIRTVALDAMGDATPFVDPVEVFFRFVLTRPLGHFGSGRNAGSVRASAPVYPIVKPDVTKLIRAVEDAMTGIVFRDDAQIVNQRAYKTYGDPERVEVVVWKIVPQS
jgi:Holliday junction resolvase RusA-like endonuclease